MWNWKMANQNRLQDLDIYSFRSSIAVVLLTKLETLLYITKTFFEKTEKKSWQITRKHYYIPVYLCAMTYVHDFCLLDCQLIALMWYMDLILYSECGGNSCCCCLLAERKKNFFYKIAQWSKNIYIFTIDIVSFIVKKTNN